MDIVTNLSKFGFVDVNTCQQLGLERKKCMVTIHIGSTGLEVIKLMKWAIGVEKNRIDEVVVHAAFWTQPTCQYICETTPGLFP